MHRRDFLGAGAIMLAGLVLPASAAPTARIRLLRDPDTGFVGFEPVGLFVEPGTRVNWENVTGVHTVTAYHPANGNRALRIPEAARPWHSGYLLHPGQTFTERLTVSGVYDYCCIPHERAGMAGRIVVGAAAGPGARAYDWFHGTAAGRDWQSVPGAVRERLPAAARILRSGRVVVR